MTQYCYVKKGFGTRVTATPYTTPQSGSFATLGAANCYDSISDVIAYNTLVKGDSIRISSLHDDRPSTTVTLNFGSAVWPELISVSDTNCDQYSQGALVGTTGAAANFVISQGGGYWKGVNMEAGQDVKIQPATMNDTPIISDSTITVGSFIAGEFWQNLNYCPLLLDNVIINIVNAGTNGGISITGLIGHLRASKIEINFPVSTTGVPALYIGNDGITFDIESLKVTNTDQIVNVTSTSDDTQGRIINSSFPAGSTLMVVPLSNSSVLQKVEFINSDIGNVKNVFTGYYHSGVVTTDTGIYHSAVFDTQNYSFLATPDADTSIFTPLRVKVGEILADFSTSKTITVRMARNDSVTALTDSEVWLEVVYPDDLTTLGFIENDRATDILSAGVAQPNGSGWTGLTGNFKEQELSVATANTGKKGVATVYANVAANVPVYFDPAISVA